VRAVRIPQSRPPDNKKARAAQPAAPAACCAHAPAAAQLPVAAGAPHARLSQGASQGCCRHLCGRAPADVACAAVPLWKLSHLADCRLGWPCMRMQQSSMRREGALGTAGPGWMRHVCMAPAPGPLHQALASQTGPRGRGARRRSARARCGPGRCWCRGWRTTCARARRPRRRVSSCPRTPTPTTAPPSRCRWRSSWRRRSCATWCTTGRRCRWAARRSAPPAYDESMLPCLVHALSERWWECCSPICRAHSSWPASRLACIRCRGTRASIGPQTWAWSRARLRQMAQAQRTPGAAPAPARPARARCWA